MFKKNKNTSNEILKVEKKLGKIQERLLDAAVDIRMNPRTSDEMAFIARQLVQVTLPHSNPGNLPAWQRRNGNFTLVIQPGWDSKRNKSIGYPYGTIPRLLLLWMTTEAVRTKSRRIELGENLSAFMREIGLVPTGGRWGSISRLREQMNRLFRSKISFEINTDSENKQGHSWMDMHVVSRGEIWWSHYEADQPNLWKSWIELDQNFFEAICSAPVPVDMRALQALKKSPLCLDLYSWITWRSYKISQSGKAQIIPWRPLMQQMGSNYNNMEDFRRKIKLSLKKIRLVYPNLHLEQVRGGLKILPTSQPAVTKNPRKLSTNFCG